MLYLQDEPIKKSKHGMQADLKALVDRLDYDPQIGMVCPKIRFAWGQHPIQYAGFTPLSRVTLRNHAIGFNELDYGQYDTAHPTPYAHGAAMMVRREVIEKAGMMPTCFFLYYEELDWSMMIQRAGYTVWYEPASTIYPDRKVLCVPITLHATACSLLSATALSHGVTCPIYTSSS